MYLRHKTASGAEYLTIDEKDSFIPDSHYEVIKAWETRVMSRNTVSTVPFDVIAQCKHYKAALERMIEVMNLCAMPDDVRSHLDNMARKALKFGD